MLEGRGLSHIDGGKVSSGVTGVGPSGAPTSPSFVLRSGLVLMSIPGSPSRGQNRGLWGLTPEFLRRVKSRGDFL